MTFKDYWNAVDERCPHCNNVTKQAKGINKQNLKKLLRFSFNDFLMLFIMIMLMVTAWAYNRDITICRDYVKQQTAIQPATTFQETKEPWWNYSVTNITREEYNNITQEYDKDKPGEEEADTFSNVTS